MTPAIASLLLMLAASTVQRNRDYADPIRLWGEATKLSPNKARVWNNYGAALADAGREIEARTALRRALQIDPDFAEARENLGLPPRHVRIH